MMFRQLSLAKHYQTLLNCYCNNLRIKSVRICRKRRHDLVINQGCGRFYCGLCPESSQYPKRFLKSLVSELFPRRVIYRPSFYANCLEANLQEIRSQDARAMPTSFYPRCVQGPGIGQASLSCQSMDLWTMWQIFLSSTVLIVLYYVVWLCFYQMEEKQTNAGHCGTSRSLKSEDRRQPQPPGMASRPTHLPMFVQDGNSWHQRRHQ